MTEKTPIKNAIFLNTNACFSPVILSQNPAAVSPQRNLTGLPRVARDIVADVYNNIQKWNEKHVHGAKIIKEIATLKSDNPKMFTPEMERLLDELYQIVQKLTIYSNALEFLSSQMNSLAKLHQLKHPLFLSHTVDSLAHIIYSISEAYKLELKSKNYILENIPHSYDKNEAMFHAACWVHQYNITSDIDMKLENLLIETGHHQVS